MKKENKSNCCKAEVKRSGDVTMFYVCLNCGKACDIYVEENKYKSVDERFDEKFRPIDFCHTGDNKMDYVEYVRNDIKEFHHSELDLAVKEALERQRVEDMKYMEHYTSCLCNFDAGECDCGLEALLNNK